jgi:hypothetical protein
MTLPIMEFHNRTGERITLSTVDRRADISTAILRHVVDVGRGVWCRPCQSADCTHANRIRDALTAAGLGNEYGIAGARRVRLPGIKHVTQYRAIRETIAACWFENGARLRYHEADDGSVRRVVFGPGDPRKPTEITILPDADSAKGCLVNALTEYCDYQREGDLAGLRREQPVLAVVVWGCGRVGEYDSRRSRITVDCRTGDECSHNVDVFGMCVALGVRLGRK